MIDIRLNNNYGGKNSRRDRSKEQSLVHQPPGNNNINNTHTKKDLLDLSVTGNPHQSTNGGVVIQQNIDFYILKSEMSNREMNASAANARSSSVQKDIFMQRNSFAHPLERKKPLLDSCERRTSKEDHHANLTKPNKRGQVGQNHLNQTFQNHTKKLAKKEKSSEILRQENTYLKEKLNLVLHELEFYKKHGGGGGAHIEQPQKASTMASFNDNKFSPSPIKVDKMKTQAFLRGKNSKNQAVSRGSKGKTKSPSPSKEKSPGRAEPLATSSTRPTFDIPLLKKCLIQKQAEAKRRNKEKEQRESKEPLVSKEASSIVKNLNKTHLSQKTSQSHSRQDKHQDQFSAGMERSGQCSLDFKDQKPRMERLTHFMQSLNKRKHSSATGKASSNSETAGGALSKPSELKEVKKRNENPMRSSAGEYFKFHKKFTDKKPLMSVGKSHVSSKKGQRELKKKKSTSVNESDHSQVHYSKIHKANHPESPSPKNHLSNKANISRLPQNESSKVKSEKISQKDKNEKNDFKGPSCLNTQSGYFAL